MAQTLSELTSRVLSRISMVTGTDTQLYAEDRVAEMIQHKFDVLFDEAWWPQFLFWRQDTLDGTLGVVTVDLTNILKRFDDVRFIYPANSNSVIPGLSAAQNPYNLSGTTPIAFGELNDPTKVFNIWPHSAIGSIEWTGRTKPDKFNPTDVINFDEQVLVLGAAFDYLEDDGTNINATQKFQVLFESRAEQLKNNMSNAPTALNPTASTQNSFTFVGLP